MKRVTSLSKTATSMGGRGKVKIDDQPGFFDEI
jgi:hypothetical protein